MTQDMPYDELLPKLLTALHWRGDERHIVESRPPGKALSDIESLRSVMARLGYTSVIHTGSIHALTDDLFPALYIDDPKQPKLLQSFGDAQKQEITKGRFVFFHRARADAEKSGISLSHEMHRFHPLLREVLLLSLIIGLVAMAPISFNRVIYDHIIASGSTAGMGIIMTGVMLALGAEIALRHVRNRRLAFFGGRLDHFVSCSVFERLLFLPPLYTERASVSAQLARLRDFESVREFFTGPLATLLFEMPLVGIYLICMAWVSQWLALVPLGVVLGYVLMILLVNGKIKEYGRISAAAATLRQEFLLETVTKLHAIRLAGVEKAWRDRYSIVSGQASLAAFRSAFAAQSLETASYVLMTIGGIATLGFGVVAVIDQHLTTGALIASMMVIWRIIAPLQICCASMTRIQQLGNSSRQVQRLLSVVPERDPYAASAARPDIKGRVTFNRVSLRYSADTEPAVLGVTFEAKPGQVVAIMGGNGCGKSSLLKLTLGLYQPQGGSVRIDGVDIRQYDPIAIRQAIAYIPQTFDMFPGTIRENLSYADPSASEEAWHKALGDACALEEIERLPHGLDTVIEGEGAIITSSKLRQRLNLARAYVKPAPIMLFDEASHSLGQENDEAFARKIAELRGRSTILLVTHREDHMRLADTLLVVHKGELTHAGQPEQILTVLRGKKA